MRLFNADGITAYSQACPVKIVCVIRYWWKEQYVGNNMTALHSVFIAAGIQRCALFANSLLILVTECTWRMCMNLLFVPVSASKKQLGYILLNLLAFNWVMVICQVWDFFNKKTRTTLNLEQELTKKSCPGSYSVEQELLELWTGRKTVKIK